MNPKGCNRLLLDALVVALNQACDGEPCYMPTRHLQLTSIQVCTACRAVATLRVRVGSETPPSLLGPRNPRKMCRREMIEDLNASGGEHTRVPPVRALCVVWGRLTKYLAHGPKMELFANLRRLEFANFFVGSLDAVVWPEGLLRLVLTARLDLPREAVPLPSSVRHLELGKYFNRLIVGVVWPAALEHLVFGERFNQPITDIDWPDSLRTMTFGDFFNKPVVGVVWPASLEKLYIGGTCFNQALEGVVWPASLRCLTLSYYCNTPIEKVDWPPSLEQLTFGCLFNQPVAGVIWPAFMQSVTFSGQFSHPVDRVVWPVSMRSLTISSRTYQFHNVILLKD